MRQGKKTVQLATAVRALSRLTTSWIASWKVLLLHLPAPKLLGSAITGCTLLLVQAPPECAGLVSNTQIAIPCSILSTPALLGQHEGLLNITYTLSTRSYGHVCNKTDVALHSQSYQQHPSTYAIGSHDTVWCRLAPEALQVCRC